jgi:AraC-like DNA-binding protein
MVFRIFGNVLANHTWSPTGHLCIAGAPQPVSHATCCHKAEINALLGRLVLRSRSDRVMCRAAQRLTTNPSISFDELAQELGVTERYLLSGLRAVLGVDPERLADLQSKKATRAI